MSLDTTGQVAEQNASYRKGLVLGLTMAEVGILIIFVLLLLIAFEQLWRDEDVRKFEGKVVLEQGRVDELSRAEATLREVAHELGVDTPKTSDDFTRLVRVVSIAAKSDEGSRTLVEARKIIDEMKDAVRQVQSVAAAGAEGGVSDMVQKVTAQSHRIANQEGQLKHYESMLETSGQGKGERPCWVKPDGRIDYLYDVVLGSTGIRMRELIYAERAEERKLLPMPAIDPTEVLSEAEFLRRTRPLFDSSLAQNCRFFVVVYDGTAVHEKALYKSELQTVEGHFYKRLSNDQPQF
jgi:hypothetical protein